MGTRVMPSVGWRINASLLGFAQRSNTDMRSVKSKEDKPVSDQYSSLASPEAIPPAAPGMVDDAGAMPAKNEPISRVMRDVERGGQARAGADERRRGRAGV